MFKRSTMSCTLRNCILMSMVSLSSRRSKAVFSFCFVMHPTFGSGVVECGPGPNPLHQLLSVMVPRSALPSASAVMPAAAPRDSVRVAAAHLDRPQTSNDLLAQYRWDQEFASFAQNHAAANPSAISLPPLALTDTASSSSTSLMVSQPIFFPSSAPYQYRPHFPMYFAPAAAPQLSVTPQCQFFGDQRPFEERKAESKFLQFTERVKNDEIRLHGKNIYERCADGSWPEALQAELEEQEAAGNTEQRNWFDHFADMSELDVDPANQFTTTEDEWSAFGQALGELQEGDDGHLAEQWFQEFRRQHQPRYELQPNNVHIAHRQPYEEGLALLRAGNLPEAILCFEAAVQQQPDHALAWQYLGTSQAENEQDPLAILALRECLRLEPDNLPALLAIATSLTNEHRNDEALEALEKWLRAHPRYRDMGSASPEGAAEDDTHDIYVMQPQLHHRVRVMFAEVAATLPGMADADVHMALGVIHHMVHQFDDAVKAFQSALQLRPEDARLWNKLGATLANSRRSEDALVAYSRALDLSPGFARAQYNVGIAYSNLVMYPEAARAFLQALHMQQSSLPGSSAGLTNSVSSAAIWEVLRSTFAMMQRPDLIEKAELGAITAFEDEFHFL